MLRSALATAAMWSLSACREETAEPETFAEPRLLHGRAAPSVARVDYKLQAPSTVEVELRAREARPSGRVTGIQGSISVDLTDLSKTRATATFDLTTLEITSSNDPQQNAEYSTQARQWLGLGANVDVEVRREVQLATFEVTQLRDVSHVEAREGKLIQKAVPSATDVGEAPDLAGATKPEIRAVRASAVGRLLLHGVRVEYRVPVTARFYYDSPALPTAVPSKIEIESRSAVKIPLAAHEIVPRNANGVLISSSLALLGKVVGREAAVTLNLQARR